MKKNLIGKIERYNVYLLRKNLAKKYISKITKIIDQIPLVKYTEDDVLAESKKDRNFYGKWKHSLVVFDDNIPVAVVIGYERKAENNIQYPNNTIYISELGVDRKYQRQGIAKKLLKIFLDYNCKKGFTYLKGEVNFSIQTNSAKWNRHVPKLYKSFGFVKRAFKIYDNRTDVVLGYQPKNNNQFFNP